MDNRQLDALVAQARGTPCLTTEQIQQATDWTIAGQPVISVRRVGGKTTVVPCPRYSTDIAEAMALVEELNAMWENCWALVKDENGWRVYENPYDHGEYPPTAKADTLPKAICLAYLKAKGIEV